MYIYKENSLYKGKKKFFLFFTKSNNALAHH